MDMKTAKLIAENHDRFWYDNDRRQEIDRHHRAYMTDFWRDAGGILGDDGSLQVQTADAYTQVESYIASLFTTNPGVVLRPGPRGTGDPDTADAAVNEGLRRARDRIELATKRALIYPMSGFKVYPDSEVEDVLDRIRIKPLLPWEIVVDPDADEWEGQAYTGTYRWVSVAEANEAFGRRAWSPAVRKDYLQSTDDGEDDALDDTGTDTEGQDDGSGLFQYIRVLELYHDGKVSWWTPNWKDGWKKLDEDANPYVDHAGNPVVPIVPLYYNQDPAHPLRGYSLMKRIYDQIAELNHLRTQGARTIRRNSRMWLARKGALSPESEDALAAGEDGTVVFVESEDQNVSPSDVLTEIPVSSPQVELENQAASVRSDMDRGGVLAPMTRGEPVKTTATEITALANYTQSGIGRLARSRDVAVAHLARVYLAVLALELDAEDERAVVVIGGRVVTLRPKDMLGDFHIYPVDSANTPANRAAKQQQIVQLAPVLAELGVSKDDIRAQIVKLFDLPEAWADNGGSQAIPGVPPGEDDPDTTPDSPTARGEAPSPRRVSEILNAPTR